METKIIIKWLMIFILLVLLSFLAKQAFKHTIDYAYQDRLEPNYIPNITKW